MRVVILNTKIKNVVQRAIRLFWVAADASISIIEKYGNKSNFKSYALQVVHKSLNTTTLKNYDINLYNTMLEWFKDNIYELTKISFAMGAAENEDEGQAKFLVIVVDGFSHHNFAYVFP